MQRVCLDTKRTIWHVEDFGQAWHAIWSRHNVVVNGHPNLTKKHVPNNPTKTSICFLGKLWKQLTHLSFNHRNHAWKRVENHSWKHKERIFVDQERKNIRRKEWTKHQS